MDLFVAMMQRANGVDMRKAGVVDVEEYRSLCMSTCSVMVGQECFSRSYATIDVVLSKFRQFLSEWGG